MDDVLLYAPSVITQPVAPTALTLYYVGGNLVLRWATDSNTHYKIFSSSLPDDPLQTLEGTSTFHQFTIPGVPAQKRFYTVVGWDGN